MSREKIDRSLGTNIVHLVQILALKKQWSKAYTTQHIADAAGFGADIVYKWRQNRITPSDETLTTLLRIGCIEAGLQRDWGVAVVQAARYQEGMALVDELWEPQAEEEVPHNLPKPTYTTFVGRADEQQRLLGLLKEESNAPLIMVNGIGGVGKTALILHTAYRCLEASIHPLSASTALNDCPTFSVIIFVSAKQKFLTADGILPRAYAPTTMRAIMREIAYVLDIDISTLTPDELPTHLRHILGRQRTLLIVDNLETVEDKDRILAFLFDLPTSVKVVITTREQRSYTPIQLNCLSESEGRSLIQHEASHQQVQLSASAIERLNIGAGGIPAALIYGVGQLATGRTLNNVLQRLADHEGDVARFFFQDSVSPLRGRPAHHLLLATALFEQPPHCQYAYQVAGLDEESDNANDASVQLLRLSLIHREQDRFVIHPLTREYTAAELTSQIEFELDARKRWLAVYRHVVAESGGADWEEWAEQYQPLKEEWGNIHALLQWCMQQRRYEDLVHFWQHSRHFLLIYAHMDDQWQLMEWLLQESERRGDWATHIDILSQKALLIILLEKDEFVEEAGQWLQRAWSLRADTSALQQSYMADNLAAWYIGGQRFTDARHWLDTATQLRQQIQSDERSLIRKEANTTYWLGVCAFQGGDRSEATKYLQEAQRLSSSIGWSRLFYSSQKWLAEVALQENNLPEAERLLLEALQVFERNGEERQAALCQCTMVHLAQQLQDPTAIKHWALKAETLLDRLGMNKQIAILQSLQCSSE